MTRAQAEARLAELQAGLASIEQRIAQLQRDGWATDGAIQECRHWLAVLDAEAAATADTPDGSD